MFEATTAKNPSINGQDIISINVPVNLDHLSYRYDSTS